MLDDLQLTFVPVTPEHWLEFEALLGGGTECQGCYCMWLREPDQELFGSRGAVGNRDAMRALIEGGKVPGLLALAGGLPVGWVAVGPRDDYPLLDRFVEFATIDPPEGPLWVCPCFYVHVGYRRRGVMSGLIEAALAYAREQGAAALEAYPVEPDADYVPHGDAFGGLLNAFMAAGFDLVGRNPTETFSAHSMGVRPVVRWTF
ncbi:MAG: GNAT family N-acetyltransferase [Chloroflexi bacterium]|jgi:GNAT superfamily N-acetyltransferase|nr:GNAT family N-acetyltransferase [Chloroflexota bacterium]